MTTEPLSDWPDAAQTYDNNGTCLTMAAGGQAYTYDAWNRPKTVAHAYRDSSNNLQSGQIFDTIGYDAAGRRITKAVNGTPKKGNSGQQVQKNFSPDERLKAQADFYNGPCGDKWPAARDAFFGAHPELKAK